MKLVFHHRLAPGDVIAMTGMVRDAKRTYPELELGVDTTNTPIWDNNPYLSLRKTEQGFPGAQVVRLDYKAGLREQKFETIHFSSYFHRLFTKATGLELPITEPIPDLHLSEKERTPVFDGRYWIVVSGGKTDMPAKVWETRRIQNVVNHLRGLGIGVIQVGDIAKNNWHPVLENVVNLVGKTSLRDVFRLIHNADGVICPITMLMHAAAALQRPCIVVAGGREAWWWEAYVRENRGLGCPEKLQVPHRYLHTIGLLDCCESHGCWKSDVVPSKRAIRCCKYPIRTESQTIPKCLDLIDEQHVLEAVMSYYEDRSLPPICYREQNPQQIDSLQFESRDDSRVKRTPFDTLPPKPSAMGTVAISQARDHKIYDHPVIGGQLTICGLLYGPYVEVHRRFLTALVGSVPAGRVDIRLASNQLCDESVAMVDELVAQGRVRKHYRFQENRKKYPVMREMFRDETCPIQTNYLVWLDDDTFCDRNAFWLERLADTVATYHPQRYRLFGPLRRSRMRPGQLKWMQEAGWYRGRPWQDGKGKESQAGNWVTFCVGALWAGHTATLLACDVPDMRLGHNGGDIQIGAQIWQGGFSCRSFSDKKELVEWSGVPRRGLSEKHPGL